MSLKTVSNMAICIQKVDMAWLMNQKRFNWVNNMNPFPRISALNLLSARDVAII